MTSNPNRTPATRPWFAAKVPLALAILLLVGATLPAASRESFDTGRLWRISKPGSADSFVLGTIHVADPRVAALAKPVEDALARSRILAVEMVPEAGDAQTFELEALENGKRIEPLIGAAVYGRLREELVAKGVPPQVVERLKPWAAMMKLARSVPETGQKTLDGQLLYAARVRRLQVLPLELLEEQISAFDTVPMDTQIAMLKHTLEHRDALVANVEPTIAAWLRGDLKALARISDQAYEKFPDLRNHYSRLVQHIIVDRTALMHHRLFMPLRKGRVFVAIGALHLYGDKGLLALLDEDGFRVTREW